MANPPPDPVPVRNPWLIALFRWYARGYLRRHLHAIRVSREGIPTLPIEGPLIVVLNHPSWWDPLVGIALAELFPDRDHFAPIEARALGKYRFLERLGFFAIETESRSRGLRFLRSCEAILRNPKAAVWVTAQGRFRDARERPPGLQPGVAHLAHRLEHGTILPLALEYPFWEERTPEALARFGSPLSLVEGPTRSVEQWRGILEQAMTETQDALAREALKREPAAFRTLLLGRTGVGGVYDLYRRAKAVLRGQRFRPEHGEPAPGEES